MTENYGRCARCGQPVRQCTCIPGVDFKTTTPLGGIILSDLKTVSYDLRSENKGNGVRCWTWEQPNKTEDIDYEIIEPKQLSQPK